MMSGEVLADLYPVKFVKEADRAHFSQLAFPASLY
jgi:hypothetical protein